MDENGLMYVVCMCLFHHNSRMHGATSNKLHPHVTYNMGNNTEG